MRKLFIVLSLLLITFVPLSVSAEEVNIDETYTPKIRSTNKDWYSGRKKTYDSKINVGTTNNVNAVKKGKFILDGETGYYQTKLFSLKYRQSANFYKSGMRIGSKYEGVVDIDGSWSHSPWYNA